MTVLAVAQIIVGTAVVLGAFVGVAALVHLANGLNHIFAELEAIRRRLDARGQVR